MVFANIRYDIVQEDIRAQMGGTVVGERGVLALVRRCGLDRFLAHKEYLFDATEVAEVCVSALLKNTTCKRTSVAASASLLAHCFSQLLGLTLMPREPRAQSFDHLNGLRVVLLITRIGAIGPRPWRCRALALQRTWIIKLIEDGRRKR